MNIIFGDKTALEDKYTVLELDTFQIGVNGPINTAYCVLDLIPLEEMALIESLKELHHDLLENYKNRNWNHCHEAIEKLKGKWNGELDTFYVELDNRIQKLKTQDLDESWSPIIPRV